MKLYSDILAVNPFHGHNRIKRNDEADTENDNCVVVGPSSKCTTSTAPTVRRSNAVESSAAAVVEEIEEHKSESLACIIERMFTVEEEHHDQVAPQTPIDSEAQEVELKDVSAWFGPETSPEQNRSRTKTMLTTFTPKLINFMSAITIGKDKAYEKYDDCDESVEVSLPKEEDQISTDISSCESIQDKIDVVNEVNAADVAQMSQQPCGQLVCGCDDPFSDNGDIVKANACTSIVLEAAYSTQECSAKATKTKMIGTLDSFMTIVRDDKSQERADCNVEVSLPKQSALLPRLRSLRGHINTIITSGDSFQSELDVAKDHSNANEREKWRWPWMPEKKSAAKAADSVNVVKGAVCSIQECTIEHVKVDSRKTLTSKLSLAPKLKNYISTMAIVKDKNCDGDETVEVSLPRGLVRIKSITSRESSEGVLDDAKEDERAGVKPEISHPVVAEAGCSAHERFTEYHAPDNVKVPEHSREVTKKMFAANLMLTPKLKGFMSRTYGKETADVSLPKGIERIKNHHAFFEDEIDIEEEDKDDATDPTQTSQQQCCHLVSNGEAYGSDTDEHDVVIADNSAKVQEGGASGDLPGPDVYARPKTRFSIGMLRSISKRVTSSNRDENAEYTTSILPIVMSTDGDKVNMPTEDEGVDGLHLQEETEDGFEYVWSDKEVAKSVESNAKGKVNVVSLRVDLKGRKKFSSFVKLDSKTVILPINRSGPTREECVAAPEQDDQPLLGKAFRVDEAKEKSSSVAVTDVSHVDGEELPQSREMHPVIDENCSFDDALEGGEDEGCESDLSAEKVRVTASRSHFASASSSTISSQPKMKKLLSSATMSPMKSVFSAKTYELKREKDHLISQHGECKSEQSLSREVSNDGCVDGRKDNCAESDFAMDDSKAIMDDLRIPLLLTPTRETASALTKEEQVGNPSDLRRMKVTLKFIGLAGVLQVSPGKKMGSQDFPDIPDNVRVVITHRQSTTSSDGFDSKTNVPSLPIFLEPTQDPAIDQVYAEWPAWKDDDSIASSLMKSSVTVTRTVRRVLNFDYLRTSTDRIKQPNQKDGMRFLASLSEAFAPELLDLQVGLMSGSDELIPLGTATVVIPGEYTRTQLDIPVVRNYSMSNYALKKKSKGISVLSKTSKYVYFSGNNDTIYKIDDGAFLRLELSTEPGAEKPTGSPYSKLSGNNHEASCKSVPMNRARLSLRKIDHMAIFKKLPLHQRILFYRDLQKRKSGNDFFPGGRDICVSRQSEVSDVSMAYLAPVTKHDVYPEISLLNDFDASSWTLQSEAETDNRPRLVVKKKSHIVGARQSTRFGAPAVRFVSADDKCQVKTGELEYPGIFTMDSYQPDESLGLLTTDTDTYAVNDDQYTDVSDSATYFSSSIHSVLSTNHPQKQTWKENIMKLVDDLVSSEDERNAIIHYALEDGLCNLVSVPTADDYTDTVADEDTFYSRRQCMPYKG